MQVRELVEQLLSMPQGAEVFVNVARSANIDQTVIKVEHNQFSKRVVICDHHVTRIEKTFRAHDGAEYVIPWK